MRIIAGDKKGMRLDSVPGMSTRPTSDKVKEAVFNVIGPFFEGGRVLDLYAGTGSLGIEALSRGMDHALFVDADRKAADIVKKNLKATGLMDKSEVYVNDADRALRALRKRELAFDLIFLDPPYAEQKIEAQLNFISDHGLLKEDGTVIAEHDAAVTLPDRVGNLEKHKTLNYRYTSISFYILSE
ncbi:MAG: 16S rRNA (guanine(966)-N(2))-methyltransferase RsmD [Bacillaceae bacterium]|nr:16S rRNA (guanine(966)-N(2))-methyltransferase RsmD [Bacillaceae bacterium]